MKNKFKGLIVAMLVLGMSLGGQTIMAAESTVISLTEEIPLRVIVEEIKYIAEKGTLSDITIQERRAGCLVESVEDEARTITLSLEGTRFRFSKLPKIKLRDGYRDLKAPKVEYLDSSQKVIGITMPYRRDSWNKGKMIMSGIEIEGLESSTGEVTLQVATLLDSEVYAEIRVAEIADFGVKLEATKKYSIKIGGSRNVSFKVKEILPDSLTSGDRMTVYLDNGYFKTDRSGNIQGGKIYLNGTDVTSKVELDGYDVSGYVTSFDITVPKLNTNKVNTLTFSNFKICADNGDYGPIQLTVEGNAVPEPVSIYLGEIIE